LLVVKATTFAIVLALLDFMVSLKSPCCTSMS
jgi:hypothetical protein